MQNAWPWPTRKLIMIVEKFSLRMMMGMIPMKMVFRIDNGAEDGSTLLMAIRATVQHSPSSRR